MSGAEYSPRRAPDLGDLSDLKQWMNEELLEISRSISRKACVYTSSYTGDGSTSQAVGGVGFKPRYLVLWPRITTAAVTFAMEATREVLDDNASGLSIVHGSANPNYHEGFVGGLTSFDRDGFTVSDTSIDDHPNKTGVVYNFICIG